MRLATRADFDYGNTRLRARRAGLLNDADYGRLLGTDVEGLLTALQESAYAPGVDASGGPGGLHRLQGAIRSHVGGSLEQLRSFYSGRARALVDALLSRFDLQNTIAVLRGCTRPDVTAEDTVAALVPVGWLGEPLAREVLTPEEPAGMVDALARAMPDREQGAVLVAAFGEYERTEDLAALERALVADHAARVFAVISGAERQGRALLRFVRRETDEHNLLVALRLRDALAAGAEEAPTPEEPLLPGGSIPARTLVSAVETEAPADIVTPIGRLDGGRWRPALERWAVTGDIHALQRSFERSSIADVIGLFRTGDPLAVDVPLAFTIALQAEARNLRLLGAAAAHGLPPEAVRGELVGTGVHQ